MQYAEGLAQAIGRTAGHECRLLFRGEQPEPTGRPTVLLQILGPHLDEPVPGMVNLLWMISPPNVAPGAMLARYQALFCASRYLTARLVQQGLDASYLPQATDAAHFHPDRQPAEGGTAPLVFVGGYAPRVDRRLVLEAVRAGFEPQIWGPGWQGVVPDRLLRGERLDYAELAETYAGARVVLNSHMSNMAILGFMSNRSYDALASGAAVVSDPVMGFADAELPGLRQVRDRAALVSALEEALASPRPDRAMRLARHDQLAAAHGFEARAEVLLQRAAQLLEQGCVAPAAFTHRGTPTASTRHGPAEGVPPRLTDPAVSASDTRRAVQAAAAEILAIVRHLEQDGPPLSPPSPAPAPQQGVIHPLMADLREVQQIALQGGGADTRIARLTELAERARRVIEALADSLPPLGFRFEPAEQDRLLVAIAQNGPLWAHGREGFTRDGGKVSVPLWGRKQPPTPEREVGVFLHLYHDGLAPAFAARLAHLACPFRLYVSTDTEAKAARLAVDLPEAEIRVLENRGRDIWPKLYGFADAYARHDIVLHLHGKKSPHSGKLDQWLSHILDCLTGSGPEVSRILSFFETIPRLGMVVPVTFRAVLGAAHWGANRDIGRELASRLALPQPLPDDASLRFPVGSMFWARVAAIRPLLDLDLRPQHFPPEEGQVDGTLAHAIERMLGVVCRQTGHHILPVTGAHANLHVKHQRTFSTNGALREALENGVFDG